MPLFEVVILEKPTNKQVREEGAEEKLVFGPKAVVANDSQSAGIRAVLNSSADLTNVDQSRMQVLVRPFA